MRRVSAITPPAVATAAAITALLLPEAAQATPPGIPTPEAARTMLQDLTVAEESPARGYSREEFPHWSTISGECTTRETVLQRDGTDVTVDGECRPVTGTWVSPYDDQAVTDPGDIDIDHVVPLAEAWRSGASEWSDDQRERFANALDVPQLIAVTATSNRSKGDMDPAQYLPPNQAYRCTYSQMWVAVKSSWKLTVQQEEKDALARVLQDC